MSRQKIAALVACAVLSLAAAAFTADRAVTPSPTDKCPVCGMFVAKHPDWIAQVVFADGTYAVFDGAKDMFKYLTDIGRYAPSRKAGDIRNIWVRDYYDLGYVDGRRAVYVIGSDIYGPMGKELIPFEKVEEAQEFLKDHKGKEILRFDQVTADLLKSLE